MAYVSRKRTRATFYVDGEDIDSTFSLAREVHEEEIDTGILDAEGNTILRVIDPIGFMRDPLKAKG